jgi:phage pi2 protein 07
MPTFFGMPEQIKIDKDKYEHLQSENQKLWEQLKVKDERIEAIEQLLVCYRLGKRPTEKLFSKLEKTKQALKGGD